MEGFKGPSPHRPLSLSDTSEIRLVKLWPGQFDGQVQCKLKHVSLKSRPKFIALSYTWGNPATTSRIILDGVQYEVTKNLHRFLQHMQSLLGSLTNISQGGTMPVSPNDQAKLQNFLTNCPYQELNEAEIACESKASHLDDAEVYAIYFWIDAICINQRDIAERSQQVQEMKNIYAAASHTYVWLEEHNSIIPSHEIEDAFSLMTELLEGLGMEITGLNWEQLGYEFMSNADFIEAEHQRALKYLTRKEIQQRIASFQTMSELVRASWFTRAWTVQEFILSRCLVTAWYGFHHIPLSTLTLVSNVCYQRLLPLYQDLDSISEKSLRTSAMGPEALLMIRAWHSDLEDESCSTSSASSDSVFATRWLGLLRLISHHFKATDPRDIVYAFLGLIPGEIPQDIQPNYTLPPAQVYRQCAVFLLRHTEHGLGQLLFAERSLSNMPSWVPDWTSFIEFPESFDGPKVSAYIELSANNDKLLVKGVRLSEVRAVLNYHMLLEDEIDTDMSLHELTPTLGMALRDLEQKCWSKLKTICPQLSFSEFRWRWEAVWSLQSASVSAYNVLTGRKSPERHERELTLQSSGLWQTYLYISRYERFGIPIFDDGHFRTKYRPEKPVVGELIYSIKGVPRFFFLKRVDDQDGYTFLGPCWFSSVAAPDEVWYGKQPLESITLL